ncbi:MAG: T9SS type A sorting domain-containing protein, partial [FCB group bacterium]|nr:T9SS type A sorting domain-containing protein [FCB group bacterium]
ITDPAADAFYVANYTVYDQLEEVYAGGITINARDYDVSAVQGNPLFNGTDLGQFDKLTIGAACRTIKAGTADYATLHYRIADSEQHPGWQTISLDDKTEWNDGESHHDKWKNTGNNPVIDISGFKGVCTLYVYFSATGEVGEFVHPATVYDASISEPYSATFTKDASILQAITKSKIRINGTSYNASDNSDDPDFHQADLGSFSTLTMNGSCLSEDNSGQDAAVYYCIKGPKQEEGKWVPLVFDEEEQFLTHSRWSFISDIEIDLSDLNAGICTLDVYFEVRKDEGGSDIGERGLGKAAAGSIITDPADEGGFYTAYFTNSNEPPLPITLSSFEAEVKDGVVHLTWETASETNNARFLVYRDGEVIAVLDGAGTTSEPQSYTCTDNYVIPGVSYTYMLADISLAGEEVLHTDREIEVMVQSGNIGMDFSIGAAYPNPFNPMTILPLNLGRNAQVTADLYDLQGRRLGELHNGIMPAGSHALKIDGARLATGIYLVHIRINGETHVQKIALMK